MKPRKVKHEKPTPRHEVRGNQFMIDKVYAAADAAGAALYRMTHADANQQRDKRQAAQAKRERKNAKRLGLL